MGGGGGEGSTSSPINNHPPPSHTQTHTIHSTSAPSTNCSANRPHHNDPKLQPHGTKKQRRYYHLPPHSHQRLPTTRHIMITAHLKHPPHKCTPTHTPLLQTPTPTCDGGHAHKLAIAIRFVEQRGTLSDKRCLGGCCGLMLHVDARWVIEIALSQIWSLPLPPPPPHAHKCREIHTQVETVHARQET